MREVRLLGVRVSSATAGLVVYLQDANSSRMLPIAVGAREGAAIAAAQAGVVPPRPMTHDLTVSLLHAVGRSTDSVEITHASGGVYFAEVVLDGNVRVDSRPSDAIAIAVRVGAPIYCAEALLAELENPAENSWEEQELAEFSSFLDSVNPADFASDDRGET